MMEDGDAAVVARVREGDVEAFGVLVERHHPMVFRLAFRMTGHQQDAEDAVQETFLRAYRHLKRFDPRASFGTWLYRIAANCSLDLLRKRQRAAEHRVSPESVATEVPEAVFVDASSPDGLAANAEIQEQVETALGRLTPLERAAFTLRHLEGQSIEEISTTLGVGSNAAKQSIFRAVHKLRQVLEPMRSLSR
jgi:RNA polymerase sigma-70 factor (ECF subfamily)